MSQNQNSKPVVTDSQETNYEASQIINNSQIMNESQDFALVVGEDSDENTKIQTQTVGDTENVQENDLEKDVVELETQIIDKNLTTPVDQTKQVEFIEGSKNDDFDDRNLEEPGGSDDDDIVQGTPPEISSPSRKLVSAKRRGESLDEPLAKIQRTLSDKDALKLDKESQENAKILKQCIGSKLLSSNLAIQENETQSNILCENTEYFDDSAKAETPASRNIIIAETQETEDSEPILFDDQSDDDNKQTENKTEKLEYKNESSLDPVVSAINATDIVADDIKESDSKIGKKVSSLSTKEIVAEAKRNGKDTEIITDENRNDEVMNVTQTDLPTKTIDGTELDERKTDGDPRAEKEFFNIPLPSSDSAADSNCELGSNSSNKSRQSIEVIYQRKSSSQDRAKLQEVVEIDEEGEKIVLDSSNAEEDKIILDSSNEEYQLRLPSCSPNGSPQNISVYKSCVETKSNTESSYKSTEWNDAQEINEVIETSDCQITNGDEDVSTSGTTKTVSEGSEAPGDDIAADMMNIEASKSVANDSDLNDGLNLKLNDTMELANIASDAEGDNSMRVHENVENKSEDTAGISSDISTASKTTAYEKRTRFYIDLKYLVHIDDNTKEIIYKEVTDVHCEPIIERSTSRRISDTSGCLADLSGNANKDTSPGSVLSNPQLFQLPTSRFSIASTISSSSSVSSAASLAAKLLKDVHFSQPKGRAKHTKRVAIDAASEEQSLVEISEKVTQGWKNAQFITDAVLQSANMVVNLPDNFQQDSEPVKSENKVLSSTPEPCAIEDKDISSTAELIEADKVITEVVTPKSTKEKKTLKRTRTKASNSTRSNGMRKVSPEVVTTSQEDRLPLSKRKRGSNDTIQSDRSTHPIVDVFTPSRARPETPRKEALRSLTPQHLLNDELVGRIVFAKWSDNNYYPGEVTDRTKCKFKVKFYDGKSKLLIEEFIIPMPDLLRKGLSVYATTKEDGYGSVGIILESENINNVIYHTVDMDNGKVVRAQTKDIFLSPDQAQILKEELDVDSKSLPKTPQHLGKVSLDNLVDGKRRSKQPNTPTTVSTPKSKRTGISPKVSKYSDSLQASGSGVARVEGKEQEISSSESENKASDSNISSTEDVDGVQPELVTIPAAQISKGPSSRMKGRGRSKSKQTQDDKELGPIPPVSSAIFKNMFFILTSTSSDIISRHQTDDSCSETGTENEEEWLRIPFVKDRVKNQLINGGGTVYDSFKQIPSTQYKDTKLITNVPNLTAKSIQCLSVGIPAYSHNWVIQCCRENKFLTPTPYELPAGWSLEKKTYIESYDRCTKQPFAGMIIAMPKLDNRNVVNRSIQFWSRICENAGAGVQIIETTESDFCHATAILTDNRCPSWLVEKADNWQIPLISTVWIVQCIIAGELLIHDTHPQYKHTFIQS